MYDNRAIHRNLESGSPALLAGSLTAGERQPERRKPPSLQVVGVTVADRSPENSPGSESLATEWVTRRNCAETNPNVFFPSDGAGVIAAQRVCRECPVKEPCREYALANNITHGVWGGTSERQRRRILRDRRRAAAAANAA